MIEVEKVKDKPLWKVKLDKKVVGEIRWDAGYHQYFPKGSREGGAQFTSLTDCIRDIKGE